MTFDIAFSVLYFKYQVSDHSFQLSLTLFLLLNLITPPIHMLEIDHH